MTLKSQFENISRLELVLDKEDKDFISNLAKLRKISVSQFIREMIKNLRKKKTNKGVLK